MIQYTLRSGFIKAYTKSFSKNSFIRKQVGDRIRLFQANPKNPLLHDHALKGKLHHFRSFSITGDWRIIYYVEQGTAYFIDIGTHNQVY